MITDRKGTNKINGASVTTRSTREITSNAAPAGTARMLTCDGPKRCERITRW